MSVMRRRLSLTIFLAVLGSLAVFAFAVSLAWWWNAQARDSALEERLAGDGVRGSGGGGVEVRHPGRLRPGRSAGAWPAAGPCGGAPRPRYRRRRVRYVPWWGGTARWAPSPRNARGCPVGFGPRKYPNPARASGIVPDANGPGKPDILMAKRVR